MLINGHEGGSAAGHVIEAFGNVVIGGNYVVGIVVFAILMIINFVVVTKGAGRISEVSARFTLDAMREQHLGDRYRLLLKAGGQYSADPLFVAEQYSLGGAYSIRGYRPSYRSGDSGYSVGAELHLALLRGATPAKTGIIPPVSALSFSLVPFLDHGGVYRNNPQPGELSEAYLTSLGSGLRMNWGPLSARLDWAVPRDGGWLLKRALTTVQVAVSF